MSQPDTFGGPQKAALVAAGWVIESTSYGMAPHFFGRPGDLRWAAEIVAYREDPQGGVHRRLRLVGWAADGPVAHEYWAVGRASAPITPGGATAVKQALLVMNDGPGLAAEVDVHIETSHDVRMDVMSLVLGNPVATISVFTLAGAFLSSMAGKAAEDAYQILKRALSRATPVVRDGSAQDTTWAVIHDVENNCVIECPKEIPAEAAAQLAQLAREGLSQRHIRWDPENRRWQAVGSISGEPPQPPPDENPPSEPPRPPDE